MIPAGLLLLVAIWEIVAVARTGHDVPTEADWRAASAKLRRHYGQGDLIVFAPPWLDPVGRYHVGDLISVDMAARMDADRYGTIWEFSARGSRAPESAGLRAEWSGLYGELQVRRFSRKPVEVTYDFVGRFPEAKASGPSAKPSAVYLEEVGFAPHRCVRLAPRPDKTVRLTFAGAHLGRSLVGYVGLADVFTRRDVREPGQLEVFVGSQKVASLRVGVNDGWVRFTADTNPGEADVVFAATAVGAKARDRLICFAAEARK